MPTPLGHALGAAAAGWAVASPLSRVDRALIVGRGIWFALLGMAPDLDLLWGLHRGPTHSVGAALIVGLAVAAFTNSARLGAASGCAYGTHALLDWLGADSSMPVGVMAVWPITWEYYQASRPIFDSVWRRNETPDFWSHNVKALLKELLILVPAAWVAWRFAARQSLMKRATGE
jgi:membrane-bound metal-dependent hydrolase YbcI (DUF457 family)